MYVQDRFENNKKFLGEGESKWVLMTYVFKSDNPTPEDIGKELGPRCLFRFLPYNFIDKKGCPKIHYLGDVKRTSKRNNMGYLDDNE